MANTDFIQATIEIFGAIITFFVSMIFIIITRIEKKSEKNLFSILLAAGFILIMDAGWYIYDGNISQTGFVLNWICNFTIFELNPIVVIILNRYLCNMMREEGNEPQKAIVYIAYILAVLAFLSPIINIFYKWMYYFDEYNVYYRMTGWYVYTVLNMLSMITCLILIIVHRKAIPVRRKRALYIMFLAQTIGIAIQASSIGISFIQIGMAFGCVFIVATYLIDWIKKENKESEVREDRKKIWLIECVFSILILFISAAIVSCAISVKTVSNKNSEQNSIALAYMVSETVESSLAEPINVSRTMAQSEAIMDALMVEDLESTEVEAKMLDFMKRIKDKYDYQMIFVASEKTKAYYTYEGLSRYMDISEDSVDAWYSDFVKRNSEYEINIDADKDNNMSLAAFVNMEVRDDDGDLLGVCGVAMSMESLMDILTQYEDRYSLKISLVNEDGLIQVDTDREKIEKEYYDLSKIVWEDSGTWFYKRTDTKSVMAKKMREYGWQIIIEDNIPDKIDVFQTILPSLIIYFIGVVLMIVFSFVFGMHEKHRSNQLFVSKQQSETAKAESFAKGRFLANMSHEIRTPINAVLGMDTMILRESTQPQIKEYAMIIQNSSNILLSLINDILDISKIESGKMEIIPEKYDFSMLISDVINMISIKAKSKNLDVKLEINKNLPSGLFGDEIRLRQIIVNLMNNAVKYTENGSITLKIDGEVVDEVLNMRVCVKDTGIGIKEEDIQKLFEDFVRIEESRNKNIEGTGLGMSITIQLLELMNSKLEVSSVYGEGSEFYFNIEQEITDWEPIGDIVLHLQEKAEKYEYSSSFTAPSANILVVDDNPVNRMVFKSLLKETMVNIDDADCGETALDYVYKNAYDIIFLDHMMPDMDGIEVLERIKDDNNHPNINTPIIVLTANAIAGAKEEYLSAGFSDYLSKPIIPEQLEKMIFTFLPKEKTIVGESIIKHDAEKDNELPIIEGVDWNYAKLHLADNVLLMNTIRSFACAIESEADYLNDIYEKLVSDITNKELLELYRIKIHAMKSTSTLLGCVPIAGMAATLENAAKTENINKIIDITPYFIESWLEYKDRLSFATIETDEKIEIDDKSLIVDYLMQLKDAAQAFDVHGADSVIEKLKKYKYDASIEAILDKIIVSVNNLDVDEVVILCEEIINKLCEG